MTAEARVVSDQLYKCIGIEGFVTPGLSLHIKEKRRMHVAAVLREQRLLQLERGGCDIEKLRCVSEESSRWSKERALNLAAGYAMLR